MTLRVPDLLAAPPPRDVSAAGPLYADVRGAFRRHLAVALALTVAIPGIMLLFDLLAGKPSPPLVYAGVLAACLLVFTPYAALHGVKVTRTIALIRDGATVTAETAGYFRTRRGRLLAVVLPGGGRTLVLDPGTSELASGSPIAALVDARRPRWVAVVTPAGLLSLGKVRRERTSRHVTLTRA